LGFSGKPSNRAVFALFCDPNLFQEIVKIFSGSFDIYLKVHIFLVLGFEHFLKHFEIKEVQTFVRVSTSFLNANFS
jgi:hypothetical protein